MNRRSLVFAGALALGVAALAWMSAPRGGSGPRPRPKSGADAAKGEPALQVAESGGVGEREQRSAVPVTELEKEAPSLRARIVDENGGPIAGARVLVAEQRQAAGSDSTVLALDEASPDSGGALEIPSWQNYAQPPAA